MMELAGGKGPPATPSESLYITGLPYDVNDDFLRGIFGQYGTVTSCKTLAAMPGKPDRVALMRMGSIEQSTWLVKNLNQNIPIGLSTPINVSFAKAKTPAPQTGFAMPQDMSAWGAGMPGMPAALPTPPPAATVYQAAAAAVAAAVPAGAAGHIPVGQMLTGKVKGWQDGRGFGFIVPDGGGPDVFVHVRELMDGQQLINGSSVMFEAQVDPNTGKYRAKMCMGAVPGPQGEIGAQLGGGMGSPMGGALGGYPPASYGMPGMRPALAAAVPGMPQLADASAGIPAPAPEAAAVSDNIFIAGLPADITEEVLRGVFGQYGQVISVKLLCHAARADKASVIKMGDVAQAKWLVDNVHQNIPVGLTTPITVQYAAASQVSAEAPLAAAPAAAWSQPAPAAPQPQLPYQEPQLFTPDGGYGKAVAAAAPAEARAEPYGAGMPPTATLAVAAAAAPADAAAQLPPTALTAPVAAEAPAADLAAAAAAASAAVFAQSMPGVVPADGAAAAAATAAAGYWDTGAAAASQLAQEA